MFTAFAGSAPATFQEKGRLVGQLTVERSGQRLAFVMVDRNGARRQVLIPPQVLATNNGVNYLEGRWLIAEARLNGRFPELMRLTIAMPEVYRYSTDKILLSQLPGKDMLSDFGAHYRGPVVGPYDALRAKVLKREAIRTIAKSGPVQLAAGTVGRVYIGGDARHYFLITQASRGGGITIDEVQEDRLTPLNDGSGCYLEKDSQRVESPTGGTTWYPGQIFRSSGSVIEIQKTNSSGNSLVVHPQIIPANVVVNTLDSGAGSLRNVITFCNANTVTDIGFSIPTSDPGFDTKAFTIKITGALPQITTAGAHLNGQDQTAATGDTNPTGPEIFVSGPGTDPTGPSGLDFNAANAVITKIGVGDFSGGAGFIARKGGPQFRACVAGVGPDGVTAHPNYTGIDVYQAPNAHVGGLPLDRCLISGNVQGGLYVDQSPNSFIRGNYVGTDYTGKVALPNGAQGIEFLNDCNGSEIGGSDVRFRNVISGNKQGGLIVFGGSSLKVLGNYIGTDVTGAVAMSNGTGGLNSIGCDNIEIGGRGATDGNVICSTQGSGIGVSSLSVNSDVPRCKILGNRIGTNAAGTVAFPNRDGIAIYDEVDAQIGDGSPEGRNIISGNNSSGIVLDTHKTGTVKILGNYLGTNIGGTGKLPNGQGISVNYNSQQCQIGGRLAGQGNLISGNLYRGILIQGQYVTVDGNLIGTTADGNSALGNAVGIEAFNTFTKQVYIGSPLAGGTNVIAGNTDDGILLSYTKLITVQNNLIGIKRNGVALPNGKNGIRFYGLTTNCLIGGNADLVGNVISGNTLAGVSLDGTLDAGKSRQSVQPFGVAPVGFPSINTIAGNIIGLNRTGGTAIPNKYGVWVRAKAHHNTIGGTTALASNTISGNTSFGVYIGDLDSNFNQVQGNRIGTNTAGTGVIPNGTNGVTIAGAAKSNAVGTTSGNIIRGNAGFGIRLAGANTSGNIVKNNELTNNVAGQIQVDTGANTNEITKNSLVTNVGPAALVVKDTASIKNNLRGNTFDVGNRLLVDLVGGTEDAFGSTESDSKDPDVGPNNLQNNANINTATLAGGTATFTGTLPSTPNTTFTVDVYMVDVANTAKHGGKLRLLTVLNLTTNASGIATFSKSLPVTGSPIGLCTQVVAPNGDTSEFGLNRLF